ncbi:hypothetical protein [Halomonas sp. TD01]|uniref:hypothetical protein n=1 Tax=Halomonas sp. TD01 TaxID=999141 RepID=UPI000214E151|nr:hypothetical protein [Halomonas sp. TD01]EGP17997.1 hypothetical protein GME_18650 [Halomonas sp. TD01]CAH1045183.1 hypothetical protein HPTD01_3661 [Halomonas sp. TD01]
MKQRAPWLLWAGAMGVILAGCAGQPTASQTPDTTAQAVSPSMAQVSPGAQSGNVTNRQVTDWVPPLLTSPEEKAAYYVSRLADRRFVSQYGGQDNPRVWYIAAERLGEIGLPAVPLLFARLNTTDDYELMLALYALQLATQDPLLMARTRGDYIQLPTVLDSAANAGNVSIANEWWQRHSAKLN